MRKGIKEYYKILKLAILWIIITYTCIKTDIDIKSTTDVAKCAAISKWDSQISTFNKKAKKSFNTSYHMYALVKNTTISKSAKKLIHKKFKYKLKT